jgi:hypothetical protein
VPVRHAGQVGMIEGIDGAAIRALMFDLGGVVIEVDFGRVVRAWAAVAGCDCEPNPPHGGTRSPFRRAIRSTGHTAPGRADRTNSANTHHARRVTIEATVNL